MKQSISLATGIRNYYQLTKPGIIYGNILTTIAGFFLGSMGHIHVSSFFGVILGTAGIIGSACVFNNYLDRSIDAKMERTKKRASVTGAVDIKHAMIFAIALGLLGTLVLLTFTNLLTLVVGLIGFIDYVIFYGFTKRRSIHGTLVGSISGSMPIVAGYTAITNHFDVGALLLFLILTLWQMPHFYAIAIYRLKDYAAASIPVLPVKKGIRITKIHMLFYLIGFLLSVLLLAFMHYAGLVYLIFLGGLSIWWLWSGIKGFQTKDDTKWARKLFFFSLIMILGISLVIPLDVIVRHGILFIW